MPTCLKGTIEFIGKNVHSEFKYTLSPTDFSMSDTFMANFKKFGFDNEEKLTLSQEYRKAILTYTNLEKEDLYNQAKAFIRRAQRLKAESLEVKAEGQGAFICLVAIFSGELPVNKQFFFTLNSVPLKLIKKEFLKKKSKPSCVNIDLRFDNTCWLNSLESLKECPKFLDIHDDTIIGNWVDAA
ncbi:MAG: hypothetical protein KC493_16840 [Bacteriovoracaceae bacterium]|nr:hypothetical protein [Bacteriovoracaceae bacterium]